MLAKQIDEIALIDDYANAAYSLILDAFLASNLIRSMRFRPFSSIVRPAGLGHYQPLSIQPGERLVSGV